MPALEYKINRIRETVEERVEAQACLVTDMTEKAFDRKDKAEEEFEEALEDLYQYVVRLQSNALRQGLELL